MTAAERENYQKFFTRLEEKLKSEEDWLSNMANLAALIYQELPKINWAGFYLRRRGEDLKLGPFQGKPAVSEITVGNGVCGTAVADAEAQLVDNVHEFPGHIACDCESESELVIPIWLNNEIIGVLDIDSPVRARFTTRDQDMLEKALEKLLTASDFSDFKV